MKEYIFKADSRVASPIEQVFAFFSNAANLQELTPTWLDFKIETPGVPLKTGALIDYRLRVHGVPLRWRTEITAWEPPGRFVDEQKRGPYRLWVHEHRFVAEKGGTRLLDHVRYRPRGGWLLDRLFVRRDIKKIFQYRAERISAIFGPARLQ